MLSGCAVRKRTAQQAHPVLRFDRDQPGSIGRKAAPDVRSKDPVLVATRDLGSDELKTGPPSLLNSFSVNQWSDGRLSDDVTDAEPGPLPLTSPVHIASIEASSIQGLEDNCLACLIHIV